MTTWTRRVMATSVVCSAVAVASVAPRAQQPAAVPSFTPAGELMKPADFREWIFLTSGLGMTYTEPAPNAAARPQAFTNVYVNPSSYREFMKSGKWPEQTMFVLEIRASASEGSINRGGHYQTELRAIEAAVKDSKRFSEGWGYFNFGPANERVAALPTSAPCYTCHNENAAVEHTFVQFYPTLMEVAKRLGTVNPGYDPNHTAR
jgi:hypothetical protein